MSKESLPHGSRTDWARLRAMRDEDIDLSDSPELGQDFLENAVLILPRRKTRITVRFDEDVVAFFKSLGRGYQTRMNAVLREYVRLASKKPTRRHKDSSRPSQ